MTPAVWFSVIGIALFGMGLLALILHNEILRRIVALNIMGSGVFLIFVAMSNRSGDPPDPVPLAMVLTGLVVSVSATALALALIVRLRQQNAASEHSGDSTS